jgi:hypothetical protein
MAYVLDADLVDRQLARIRAALNVGNDGFVGWSHGVPGIHGVSVVVWILSANYTIIRRIYSTISFGAAASRAVTLHDSGVVEAGFRQQQGRIAMVDKPVGQAQAQQRLGTQTG